MAAMERRRHATVGVRVGPLQVGGGAPVVVQSMANTDTADVASTSRQCIELAQAAATEAETLFMLKIADRHAAPWSAALNSRRPCCLAKPPAAP